MQINARNKTQVAQLVHSIIQGDNVSLTSIVTGHQALEMLVEIGIEKLKRDYSNRLLNNLLATRDDLDQIFKDQSGDLLILDKLHCINALVGLCQTFVSLNRATLRSIVQQSISILSRKSEIQKELTLKLMGSQVKEQISTVCPSIWQCHFSSTSSNKSRVKSTIHLTTEMSSNDMSKDEEEDETRQETLYTFLKGTAITRNF